VRWDIGYAHWYWNEQGDPMAPGWEWCQRFAADGWELVGVVSHPDISWESPRGVSYAGSSTLGCWFVATFKKSVDDVPG